MPLVPDTGRFGPIPVRTSGRFGPIPFRPGRFGPISGVGCFGLFFGESFRPTLYYTVLDNKKFFELARLILCSF